MIRFGTDGIRGTAGQSPCTAELALNVGRAAVLLAGEGTESRVMVARDTRPSGPMFEASIVAGVAAAGGQAIVAGVLPTAGLMANIEAGAADVGVMITASHNPHSDNGFKIIGKHGKKLSDADSMQFETWLNNPADSTQIGGVVQEQLAARSNYFEALGRVCPDPAALHGARIAVDFSNGAAVGTGRWLQDRYGGVNWIFTGQGNGLINHGVGSENPEHLSAIIRENDCDGGFAVDGDADRCVTFDEEGNIVSGDALAWFLARQMGIKTLAVTVMSNGALESSLPGVSVTRTPVGDRNLMKAMDAQGILLGCEESGHVLFGDGLPGGDGVVTGLRVLGYVMASTVKFSEQCAEFSPLHRRKGKVPSHEKRPLSTYPTLHQMIEEAPVRLDGGRVLVRYSGTEPALRILVEGSTLAKVDVIYEDIVRHAQEVVR
jgi:phosphoglucosamine mutase